MKPSFKIIKINSETLDFIQMNIIDLKLVQTRDRKKKHYITFINDDTKYCYILLIEARIRLLKYLNIIRIKLKINLTIK